MSIAAHISAARPQVWLIKAPPSVSGESYTSELEAAGFETLYIPAIIEEYDTAELEKLLAEGGSEWDGVIITSKRGAEGWVRAVKAIQKLNRHISGFSTLPLFTVGTTSIDALASSDISHHLLPDLMDATSAISALELAKNILESPPELRNQDASHGRYLFIRGDKSANDLQPILRKAGCTVDEVQVYTTSANPHLAQSIAHASSARPSDRGLWLTFFSPSTAGYALPHLGHLLCPPGGSRSPTVRVAAIGEKTRAFLQENDVQVDVVAEEPNASGLLRALQGAV